MCRHCHVQGSFVVHVVVACTVTAPECHAEVLDVCCVQHVASTRQSVAPGIRRRTVYALVTLSEVPSVSYLRQKTLLVSFVGSHSSLSVD